MIFLLLILVILIPTLTKPYISYNDQISISNTYDNKFSSFTLEDISMGEWIKENVPKETIIISEPYQQLILSGISGIESLGGGSMNI